MKLWDRERRRRRVRGDGGSRLRRLLNASRKWGRTQPTSGPHYSSSQLLAIPFTICGVSLSHNCTQGGGGGVDRRCRMYTNTHRYVKFSVLRVWARITWLVINRQATLGLLILVSFSMHPSLWSASCCSNCFVFHLDQVKSKILGHDLFRLFVRRPMQQRMFTFDVYLCVSGVEL
jgi:hypothetical protein